MGPMGQGFEPPPPIQFYNFVEIAIACLKGTEKAIGSRAVSAIAPGRAPGFFSEPQGGGMARTSGETVSTIPLVAKQYENGVPENSGHHPLRPLVDTTVDTTLDTTVDTTVDTDGGHRRWSPQWFKLWTEQWTPRWTPRWFKRGNSNGSGAKWLPYSCSFLPSPFFIERML